MTDYTIKDQIALVGIGDAVEVVWESMRTSRWCNGREYGRDKAPSNDTAVQVGPRLSVALFIAMLQSTVIGLGWCIPDF
jgi:hypothetical protein